MSDPMADGEGSASSSARAGLFACICAVPAGTPPRDHDAICRQWNGARLLSFLSNNSEESPSDGR